MSDGAPTSTSMSTNHHTTNTMAKIVSTPDILGGKARLANHRISVVDIVELLDDGDTVAEAAAALAVTTDEIEAARQYWEEHPEEIAEQRERRKALYEELVEQSRAQKA